MESDIRLLTGTLAPSVLLILLLVGCSPREASYNFGTPCYREEFKALLKKNGIKFSEHDGAVEAAPGQVVEFLKVAEQFTNYITVRESIGNACDKR